MRFLLSVDLGQVADYTAITITERVHTFKEIRSNLTPDILVSKYHVRHIERMQKPYTEVVERVKSLQKTPALKGENILLVDATGVGRAVVDLMRNEQMRPIAITITGGQQIIHRPDGYTVPKAELVTALQIVFQARRINFVDNDAAWKDYGVPSLAVVKDELKNFRAKVTKTAHAQFEAVTGEHDDIVLSLSQALWYGEKFPVGMNLQKQAQQYDSYNPLARDK